MIKKAFSFYTDRFDSAGALLFLYTKIQFINFEGIF